jgi:hypothetical protein
MQNWIDSVRLWLLSLPPGHATAYFVLAAAASIFILANGGMWPRTRRSRHPAWRSRNVRKFAVVQPDLRDPSAQMQAIARAEFEPRRLLNKSEYGVLLILEAAARDVNRGLRVMAQTSMGELVRTKDDSASQEECDRAYRSINSKRLDFVVIDPYGLPVLAVEHQGTGHYQASAFMRDAVKREVLRKAKIRLLEIPADYNRTELVKQLRAVLGGVR